MRYRHIAIGLIALSLMAVAFVATAAATEYNPYMYVDRKGKYRIFTIDTTSGGGFDGSKVIKSSIVITIYINAIDFFTYHPDPSNITLTETSIIIQLVKQDLPRTATASHATGNVGTLGETFYASGPGWAFGNVH